MQIPIKGTTKIYSLVQIRGSLPFLWKQYPDLKCVPKVEIDPDVTSNLEAFNKHINSLNLEYGLIIILNLIDRKRVQKRLGEFFESLVRSSQVMK